MIASYFQKQLLSTVKDLRQKYKTNETDLCISFPTSFSRKKKKKRCTDTGAHTHKIFRDCYHIYMLNVLFYMCIEYISQMFAYGFSCDSH